MHISSVNLVNNVRSLRACCGDIKVCPGNIRVCRVDIRVCHGNMRGLSLKY